MSYQQDRSNQGRIPFRLRSGVTGHRRLADEEALAGQVRRALQRIRELAPSSPYTQVLFTVVSPLAEGADRLVVRQALQEEWADLEVTLPLPREEYLRDFESDESKREFDALLARAKVVTQLLPSRSRDEAYERVGHHIVDSCDVLIALWDGEAAGRQGGTGEIVAYARRRRIPLLWIVAKGQHQIVEELGAGIGGRTFRELDRYNRGEISQERFEQEIDRQERYLLTAGDSSEIKGLPVQAFSGWALPYFARADLLAQRYQTWYRALGNALFLLAAAAVVAIACQALFAPETRQLAWIEVAFMLGLLLVVAVGWWFRFSRRWISYRFLAERFRSALFLASVGLHDRRESGLGRVYLGHPSEEWLRRAFGVGWDRRPQAEMTESNVEELRGFLTKAWIENQLNYYRGMNWKYKLRHFWLSRATEILFAAAVLAAILHGLEIGGSGSAGPVAWADLLIVLAISLPALGGATIGIRAQREYQSNSERFGQMGHYLDSIGERMKTAPNLERIRAVAAEAEDLMLQENRDWIVAMRFHDFELRM